MGGSVGGESWRGSVAPLAEVSLVFTVAWHVYCGGLFAECRHRQLHSYWAWSLSRSALIRFRFIKIDHNSELEFRLVLTLKNKKLSYRRGTARRAVSVKTVLNVTQMFVELHVISPALGKWPSRSSKDCRTLTYVMPVLFTFGMQTKFEMCSFICSRNMAWTPKCRNGSCDPDHAHFGGYLVMKRPILHMAYSCTKFEVSSCSRCRHTSEGVKL